MLNFLKYSLFLFGLFFQAIQVFADERLNRENQIKAVYLIHFAELTRWPEQLAKSSTFNICLFNKPELVPFLEEFSQELVHGKQLKIEIIDTVYKQNQCRIIYFNNTEFFQFEKDFAESYPETLFVGNNRSFIEMGGSISFSVVNNKIKLIINLSQIRKSGLDISSKLLRIAEIFESSSKIFRIAWNY